jgi:ERCC4-type nuclease
MSNYGGFRGGFNHSGPKKAKNPYNQAALDKLRSMAEEPRYANNPHYPRVFRCGMASLAKAAGEIRTVDEAIQLDRVGEFLAKIIAGAARKANGDGGGGYEDNGDDTSTARDAGERPSSRGSSGSRNGRKKKAASVTSASEAAGGDATTGRKRKALAAAEPQHQLSIVPPSAVGAVAVPTAAAPARKKRARKATATTTSAASVSDPAKPSAKQTAYARAVREGEGLSATLDQYGDWRVILLVDRRERKADHMQAKLLMSGIDAEVRQLPIGDMLWIARGRRKRITPGSGLGLGGAAEKQSVEVVLGTVVERKTLEDLTSSLFGTRFEEQRLRLKNSAAGANQVLYLVEAEKVTDLPNCSGSTLRYAMMQTQVHLGFAVVRTKGIDDTVRYLRRVHRRLMRRSFPTEFSSAEFDGVGTGRAIPTFTSPNGRIRQDDRTNAGKAEMVFQNPPVPFEARRHTVYEEFKAKIELARETGTRSVKALHCAMLKQVDSWAIAKVHALAKLYETPSSLARAYREALARGGLDEADAMVQDVSVGMSSARARRIGPKSSSELAKVYLAGVDEEDYAENEGEKLAFKLGGEEGDRMEEAPKESYLADAYAASAATLASPPAACPSAPVAQSKKKCSYGNCSDLSSGDDDDASYERMPRRREDDIGDLNRKPAALSRDQLAVRRDQHQPSAAIKTSSIQYDYEFSSDSDDAYGRQIGADGDDNDMQRAINASLQSLAAERSKSKQTRTTPASTKSESKADCFDLTIGSSDDDDGNSDDDKSTEIGKVSLINEHASATALQPRLSHDGIGSDRNFSSGEDNGDESDSESSCDELVVRLRQKAAAADQKVRLYDSTNTSTASTINDSENADGGRKRHFFPTSASSADSPAEEEGKESQASPPAGESDSDGDVEIIELSD